MYGRDKERLQHVVLGGLEGGASYGIFENDYIHVEVRKRG
jgi:hypothetical protein